MGITLNPCDEITPASGNATVLTNGDLTISCNNGLLLAGSRGTYGQSTGKYYWEMHIDKFVVGNTNFLMDALALSTTLTGNISDHRVGISLQCGSVSPPPFTSLSTNLYIHNAAAWTDSSSVFFKSG